MILNPRGHVLGQQDFREGHAKHWRRERQMSGSRVKAFGMPQVHQNIHHAGQIVATSHDLGKEMPLFQQKSMLVKYYNLARSWECWCTHTMTQGVFSSPRLLERSLEVCANPVPVGFWKEGNRTVSRPIFVWQWLSSNICFRKKKMEIPQLIQLQSTPKSRLHFSLLLSRPDPLPKPMPCCKVDPGGLILGPHLCACEVAFCGALAAGWEWPGA